MGEDVHRFILGSDLANRRPLNRSWRGYPVRLPLEVNRNLVAVRQNIVDSKASEISVRGDSVVGSAMISPWIFMLGCPG